jgi:hypothetical protein
MIATGVADPIRLVQATGGEAYLHFQWQCASKDGSFLLANVILGVGRPLSLRVPLGQAGAERARLQGLLLIASCIMAIVLRNDFFQTEFTKYVGIGW